MQEVLCSFNDRSYSRSICPSCCRFIGTIALIQILFLSAIPIAIVANIFRVVLILVIAYYWGEDVAMEFFHEASSLFLFLLAFVFLILIGRLIGCKGVRNISR